jgi:hypothetical protein
VFGRPVNVTTAARKGRARSMESNAATGTATCSTVFPPFRGAACRKANNSTRLERG